jgi:hypothetical protein
MQLSLFVVLLLSPWLVQVYTADDAASNATTVLLSSDDTCQAVDASEDLPSLPSSHIVLDDDYDPQPDYQALAAQVRTIYEEAATAETLSLSPKLDSALVRPPPPPSRNNHSTAAANATRRTLSVNSLTRVLSIQVEHDDFVVPNVTVQARCTFEALVQATLPYGYIPAVVPEFVTITVGGAIVGAALESSSFRHGPSFGYRHTRSNPLGQWYHCGSDVQGRIVPRLARIVRQSRSGLASHAAVAMSSSRSCRILLFDLFVPTMSWRQ